MPHHPLTALFDPTNIAVFGASGRKDSVGGIVYGNLLHGKFPGRLVPVNPKHRFIDGVKCYPTIGGVDAPIDLAVVATPAHAVEGVVADCAAAGVKAMIVLSAGFGELGAEGRLAQERLRAMARAAGMRLLGPNCVGLVRPPHQMNATFLRGGTPAGGLALVSQSGAICAAISDGAAPNHLGFSALVSLGNAADLDVGEIVGFLADDPATEAILLYLEGIREAGMFISAVRRAARLKPVVVLKAGRGAKAGKAAATHTGALLGSDAVFAAALERTGAVRVSTFGQLFAAAELLSKRQRIAGNRLCILTNGGGAGVLAADRADDLGIDLPKPSQETLVTLDGFLPRYWSHSNPVDILGDARPEHYAKALEACLSDPAFDGVLVMLTPQAVTDPMGVANKVIAAANNGKSKPVLACWMGESAVQSARHRMSEAGVPDFAVPELAVEAFSYLAGHERNRRLALELPGPRQGSPADFAQARGIAVAALAGGRTSLTSAETRSMLAAAGIPVIQAFAASDAEAAAGVADRIGYPVAVKIASPDISHKTEVAGVALDLGDAAAVRVATSRILETARRLRPEARIDGVTIERMAGKTLDRELLLGIGQDPVFGPSIIFGSGGTKVEVIKDSAVSLPPLTSVLAERLIAGTKVAGMLGPFRGAPAIDHAALIDALLRLSDLACEVPEIAELDINPLLAGPDGVLAVDARASLRRRPETSDPYGHLAIAPWPRQLTKVIPLADGSLLTLRPIRPEDAAQEQAFVQALSSQARHSRFLQSVKELTPELLSQFTDIDYRQDMALVAVIAQGEGERQYGVARFSLELDGESCEFAIVVADQMRHQGIGSALLTELIGIAKARGIRRMIGRVLAQNDDMLTLAREAGFSARLSPDEPGLVVVERSLVD